MTFGDYIRTRKHYTETGYLLRQALLDLPDEVQTPGALYAWLYARGATPAVLMAAIDAADSHRDMMRQRAKRARAAGL